MKKHLTANRIEFIEQCLVPETLTYAQLLEILEYTENGLEDILSIKSHDYKRLIERGIDFDELTLTQFYQLTLDHPNLIKFPILTAKNTTLVGYNVEEMSLLKNRKDRKSEYNQILSTLQMNDVNIPDDELYVY